MRQLGIIGYPLGHSFSRKYFTEKFQKGNIKAEYINFEISHIEEIEKIVKEHKELVGFNVTLPYKTRIIPYLTYLSPAAENIGAVNCVKINRDRNGITMTGYNTDAIGFEKSLSGFIPSVVRKALVLGNGGAAKAVRYILEQKGICYRTVTRTPHQDPEIGYSEIGKSIGSHKLIVNCTPLGMWPDCDTAPDIPYERLTSEHYLFDLTYNPQITEFMKRGMRRGAKVKNGYEMLVGQAEAGWSIWNS